MKQPMEGRLAGTRVTPLSLACAEGRLNDPSLVCREKQAIIAVVIGIGRLIGVGLQSMLCA